MDLIAARAIHVVAVVLWIGGVAFVTMVALPAARAGALGADRAQAFFALERRFARIARWSIGAAGASGLYLVVQYDAWARFADLSFWWMDAMVGVWALFAGIVYIAEPFALDRILAAAMRRSEDRAFGRLQRAHWILLAASLVTILGAVAGAHG
jgi:uncharacterized membrane protein